MKTNLKTLISNDKFNAFWFTFDDVTLPSSEVTCDASDIIDLNFVGYIGKDVDGFDKWVIEASGEGFTAKGSFYNENDYLAIVNRT